MLKYKYTITNWRVKKYYRYQTGWGGENNSLITCNTFKGYM
jgi:hypothetical protein